jgi:thiosulfate dehydrogenase [quinone] large subunit
MQRLKFTYVHIQMRKNSMSTTKFMQPQVATQIPEPPIARFLFSDTRMAWFWLIVRLYVGYEWLTAGWEKLTGHSISFGSFGVASAGGPWVFSGHDGAAIQGFVAGAVAQAKGANPAVQGWYASFLQSFVKIGGCVRRTSKKRVDS